MSTLDDLLTEIFDTLHPAFYTEFENWVRASRRFRAFATEYRVKIRAKLRNIKDEAGMSDLRAELETAACLLTDKRFTLEYEKYAASKQRGPDFTVTFKTHTPFNVEVRRLRSLDLTGVSPDAQTLKLMTVLSDKVGQMPAGIINLLWLTAGQPVPETDLTRALATLLQRAEQKQEDFFTRRGFKNAADFLRQYQHLSGIILFQSENTTLWSNPLARHKIPPEIATALRRF